MGEKIFLVPLDGDSEALVSRLRKAGHEAGEEPEGGTWFIPSEDYSYMENWQAMVEGHFKCSFSPTAPSAGQG